MLRKFLSKPAFDSLASNGFNISNNPVCVLSVRWRRKPRWIPQAKSKVFRVPERKSMPEVEAQEWLRINQNYKTQMRSVRAWFREEVESKKRMVAQSLTPADEEAEFQRCSSINDEWNLEIAKKRDIRLKEANAARRAHIERGLELKTIHQKEVSDRIEEIVRKEKESSATFITRASIDRAIEEALANPTEPNFSIDLQGTIYKGKDRPAPQSKKVET